MRDCSRGLALKLWRLILTGDMRMLYTEAHSISVTPVSEANSHCSRSGESGRQGPDLGFLPLLRYELPQDPSKAIGTELSVSRDCRYWSPETRAGVENDPGPTARPLQQRQGSLRAEASSPPGVAIGANVRNAHQASIASVVHSRSDSRANCSTLEETFSLPLEVSAAPYSTWNGVGGSGVDRRHGGGCSPLHPLTSKEHGEGKPTSVN